MVKTPSTMPALGMKAPDFTLPEPATGGTVSLDDFAEAPALLVIFMSNHCPYVKHIADDLATFAREYREKGLATVGICANDADKYPDDGPDEIAQEVEARGYGFSYLFDETQDVAKAYRAACTPDFFLFDQTRALTYRGQFDPSRPGSDTPVTGSDLRAACDAVLAGHAPAAEQTPSIGCNIKWKAGNAPAWFG